MGTTTIFLRFNDLHTPLSSLKKNELKKIDELSPYRAENDCHGWRTPMELHNGNVHILVWWKGRLMRIEDAPKTLCNKYYDKYRGKTLPVYEWTLLRRLALGEIEELDKKFRKIARGKRKGEHSGSHSAEA